jgi:hypothetical protein
MTGWWDGSQTRGMTDSERTPRPPVGLPLPALITIPTTDTAFHAYVARVRARNLGVTPQQLQAHLRRVFPRVLVRNRDLAGTPEAWYVYRDGGWVPPPSVDWSLEPGVPRLTLSADGWLIDADPTALGLLEIDSIVDRAWHYTDFVVPGTLADANALFDIVREGNDLTATVLVRPTTGDVIAVDIRARRDGEVYRVSMRLASDVEIPPVEAVRAVPALRCQPRGDVAFSRYAQEAVERMPEPTPDGLALRLRRLYPHARVEADGSTWTVIRERDGLPASDGHWWLEPRLPRVRYDAQALILEANDAARELLGSDLVGHFWQEFVTPGSTDEVAAMLGILRAVGGAESRFRMPGPGGALVEFDSYTQVEGEQFTTFMRPRSHA